MANNYLDDIVFITLPASMARDIGGFKIDPARQLPLQLPAGKHTLDSDTEISIEMIVSGMLKIIAYETGNPNYEYYKGFVLAAEPDCVNQLNLAAIAQEQAGHLDFSEELFLTVCHLAPQSATYINLATCYSTRAAKDTTKGTAYDMYAQKALDTLLEGLKEFPKDADLLGEIGWFHLYQGNTETARNYFEQYLAVAPKGEKRNKVERVFADIEKKISNDTALMSAYDQIQMGEEEKALESLGTYITRNPSVWNAWFLKGWAYRRLERFEEAKEAFLKCIALGESDADIYNELSLSEFALGNKDLAKNYLDTAVDLDGGNLTYLSNLAYMHMNDGEYEEARKFLEQARNLDAKDPLIVQLMKDYEKATGDKLADPISEQVVDDDTLKEAVKKQDDADTKHDFAAHREDLEEDEEDSCDDDGCHHHSDEE